jgi:hypothetical protein
MATLTTQSVTTAGLEATYVTPTATTGDRFLPAAGTFIHIINGSGGSVNITLTTPYTLDGLALADRVIAVPASEERFIAVPDTLYRSSDGLGDLLVSSVTSVTIAVIRI